MTRPYPPPLRGKLAVRGVRYPLLFIWRTIHYAGQANRGVRKVIRL